MIVKEYIQNPAPGQIVHASRVNHPDEALDLFWVRARGGNLVWEPDEQGYGLVFSWLGYLIAVILPNRGEK